ncbi:TolC family protein [Nibrella saemangeumensis]|uniref:TolC family protein n=1 Tax=Nibrella saemangeumensis TaxID=1084526 RepID=A0ABP8N214_9BACT
MNKFLLGFISWLSLNTVQAQNTVTLEQAYTAAIQNYPLTRQKEMGQQAGDLALANLDLNRRLPQLALNGQATWQSEVTKLPIELPNIKVPQLSKDQYRLTLDASYLLYDGGLTKLQQQVQQANTAIEQQRVDVELNRLKDQVNTFFLNALLTDENRQLTEALLADLKNRIEKTAANVKFGTAAQLNLDALQAEYLKAEQRLAELTAVRKGLRDLLALLTGLPVTETTTLQIADNSLATDNLPIQRPELKLYSLQRSLFEDQTKLTDNRRFPRISAFAQPGIGRPGLNFLNNDFRSFFIGGIRLNWAFNNTYTLKNDRQILSLNRQQVDIQQAAFEKNLSIQLRQQQNEVERIQAIIEKDRDIVALRSRIRQATAVQLDNGAIAARDYATELNAENQAQLNLKVHELQLIMARIQYRTLTGN